MVEMTLAVMLAATLLSARDGPRMKLL